MMKATIRFLRFFLNISFKPINKIDVILLDENYSSLNFDHLSYEVVNFKKINFFCAVKSLYKFLIKENLNLNLRETYLKNLYRSYSPKVAISHHLNKRALLCKYLCPEIFTITYQFSYVNKYVKRTLGLDYKTEKKYKSCDYFCIFHESDKKIFEKYFTSSFIVTGSIKNNEIILDDKNKNIKKLMYISEYSPSRLNTKDHYHTKSESFIVKMLKKYCEKNNFSLNIALRSNRRDKENKLNRESEINYFKSLIGDTFHYQSKSSYQLASESNLTICMSSNLGIELLSRKYKVLFLPYHDYFNKEEIYPYIENSISPFVHRNFNEDEISEKINKLLNLDSIDWEKVITKYSTPILFDKNNSILKKKIFALCNLKIT